MKFRTDFVTNSSSSFIVNKKLPAPITVDSVYTLLRGLYIDLDNKYKEIVKYIEPYGLRIVKHSELLNNNLKERQRYIELCKKFCWPDTPLDYRFVVNNKWNRVHFLTHENDMYAKLYNEILQKFRVNLNNPIMDLPEWISCETYAQYENYPLAEERPFTIISLKTDNAMIERELIEWYFGNRPYDCFENCARCKSSEDCDIKTQIEKRGYSTKNVDLSLRKLISTMGDICIYSWDTAIPFDIVEWLYEYCDYACNHMG